MPTMNQPMPRPEERCRDRSELPPPPAYRSEGFYEDLGDEAPALPARHARPRRAGPWSLALMTATLSFRPAG
jgi:hypothetical protein